MTALYIILGIILLLAVILVSLYNKLVRQKVVIGEASADIETMLKQRYDMIPNLVSIVKGYAQHEKGTFESVTELRSKAMNAGSFEEKAQLEDQLSKGLSKIFALAENYPELKANTNFLELQTTLKDLEDSIQKSRRFYNGTVRDFNTTIVVFPNNILANMLGFKAEPFFEASEEEQKNVEIKF
ncbi:LemA family protein [Patescibacteria group bacterium]|nr:LemA family protein [Patescibacteria group bacterium]